MNATCSRRSCESYTKHGVSRSNCPYVNKKKLTDVWREEPSGEVDDTAALLGGDAARGCDHEPAASERRDALEVWTRREDVRRVGVYRECISD